MQLLIAVYLESEEEMGRGKSREASRRSPFHFQEICPFRVCTQGEGPRRPSFQEAPLSSAPVMVASVPRDEVECRVRRPRL